MHVIKTKLIWRLQPNPMLEPPAVTLEPGELPKSRCLISKMECSSGPTPRSELPLGFRWELKTCTSEETAIRVECIP